MSVMGLTGLSDRGLERREGTSRLSPDFPGFSPRIFLRDGAAGKGRAACPPATRLLVKETSRLSPFVQITLASQKLGFYIHQISSG